jgi:hypothetical protein
MQGRTLSFDPEDELEVSTVRVPAANDQPAFSKQKLVNQNLDFLAAQLLKSLPFKHTYAPLELGQVRILTVRRGSEEDPLELDLHAHDGQGLSNYQALSYVWGTAPRSHEVILRDFSSSLRARFPPGSRRGDRLRFVIQRMKGTKTYIRPSLFDALVRVRRVGSDIRVWADALCINQNNAAEKTSQISQLHNLYQMAHNVFVWLGNGNPSTKIALDFILELVDVDGLSTLLNQPKPALKKKADALLEMMKSPWFTRRWVIQEIVLAKRASIWCGPGKMKPVNWDDFADALTTFKVHVLPALDYVVQDVLAYGAQVLVHQKGYLLRDSGSSMVFTTSLEDLISHLTPFNAGDPRDIVYGVISISREQHSDGWYSPTRPDYRKSLLDVYVEFVESCVKNSGRLDIICRPWVPEITALKQDVPIQERVGFYELTVDNDLPSWMKTLRHHPYGSGEDVYEGRQYGDIFATAKPTYNACGTCQFDEDTRPKFGTRDARVFVTANIKHQAYITDALDENPEVFYETFDGTLEVQGVVLGAIGQLSDACTGGIIPKEALRMGGWTFPDRRMSQFIDAVPDRLWRTLVANLGFDRGPPPTYYRRACLWALQRMSRAGDLEIKKLLDAHPDFPYKNFLRRVVDTTMRRRFFKCTVASGVNGGDLNGQLYGLCPEDTVQTDLVCILYGCHVPVVLRKRSTRPDFGLANPKLKGFHPGTAIELHNHHTRGRSNRPMSPTPEPGPVVQSFPMPGSFPIDAELDSALEGVGQIEPPTIPAPEPRILKKEEVIGEFYEVIGECYVYGYMDGEIIKQEPWKNKKTFVLR